MKGPYKAVEIHPNVYWVGAIDWFLQDFHGYATNRGSTYNAYLIIDEKITLVDTVKQGFYDEMYSRISSVIDPGKIDYIISNHAEMDHSGCLCKSIEEMKPEKVFASKMGKKALFQHFKLEGIEEVKEGEEISLGKESIKFIESRMLHWPDSMMSYLTKSKILFSQDGFGMHLATSHIMDVDNPEGVLYWEASKYYANILLPYSPLVLKFAEKIQKMGLEISMIAPDHGPVWKEKIPFIMDLYTKWATQKPQRKVVILYSTMWASTAQMAKAIAEGVQQKGVEVVFLNQKHRSEIITHLLNGGALILGSPTLNNGIFPQLADYLTYIKGLKPKNLIGTAFGSYGWSGEAVTQLKESLENMGVEVFHEGIRVQYVPTSEDLDKCFQLGVDVAEELIKRIPE